MPGSADHLGPLQNALPKSPEPRNESGWKERRDRLNSLLKTTRLKMNPEIAAHRIAAENVLGKPLPLGVVVHHLDKNRKNDRNNNLVICENTKYHVLLHIRQRAKDAGFEPDWRKCSKCREYDHPDSLTFKKVLSGRLPWKRKLVKRVRHPYCIAFKGKKPDVAVPCFGVAQNLLRNGRLAKITSMGMIYTRTATGLLKLKNQPMIYGEGLDFEPKKVEK